MKVSLLSILLGLLLLSGALAKLSAPNCKAAYSEREFSGKKRNETILCAFAAVDTNHDGGIDQREYNAYCDRKLKGATWYLAPKFSTMQEKCDCNLDGYITAEEMTHAFQTCLESDFWVDRVHGYVC
jgi:hypothetical protein